MSQNGKNITKNITKVEFDLIDFHSEWFSASITNDSGNFTWTNLVWMS